MTDKSKIVEMIRELLLSQNLAILATSNEGQPYVNLVAFVSEDLKSLIFSTPKTTRKYANIVKEPRVALVIDNRSNNPADFHKAIAVTLTGSIQELRGVEREKFLKLYLKKFPYLKDYATPSHCALLKVMPANYNLVINFRNVFEIRMEE